MSSRSDRATGNCGGGRDDDDGPPEERPSKKRSAHEMDVDNADDDEDEDDQEEDEVKAKKRPPQGLLKVSQALQGLGYIYEKDRNARHPDTPSVRAGAVYWK